MWQCRHISYPTCLGERHLTQLSVLDCVSVEVLGYEAMLLR